MLSRLSAVAVLVAKLSCPSVVSVLVGVLDGEVAARRPLGSTLRAHGCLSLSLRCPPLRTWPVALLAAAAAAAAAGIVHVHVRTAAAAAAVVVSSAAARIVHSCILAAAAAAAAVTAAGGGAACCIVARRAARSVAAVKVVNVITLGLLR